MIEIFFFDSEKEIRQVTIELFSALGLNKLILEGDSQHSLEGYYFSISIFGVAIKLEYNSYDYDDRYRYMLSLRKDKHGLIEIKDDILILVKNIFLLLLPDILHSEFAYEDEIGKLKIY